MTVLLYGVAVSSVYIAIHLPIIALNDLLH